MKVKLIDPNVMYAGKILGKKGDVLDAKDLALKLGVKETEAEKIFNILLKKGLVAVFNEISVTIKEVPKKRKLKPMQDKIEVANGDSSVDSFE